MDTLQLGMFEKCPFYRGKMEGERDGKRVVSLMCEGHVGTWYPNNNGPGRYERCCCKDWETCPVAKKLRERYE